MYVKSVFAGIKLTDEQNKKVEALVDKICEDPDLSVDGKTYQSVRRKVEELLPRNRWQRLRAAAR